MLKLPCMSADGARAITRPKIIRQERNVHLIWWQLFYFGITEWRTWVTLYMYSGSHVCQRIGMKWPILIPSFSSFGRDVSDEKIKMWKANGQRTPSDGKSSHWLWQDELKKKGGSGIWNGHNFATNEGLKFLFLWVLIDKQEIYKFQHWWKLSWYL